MEPRQATLVYLGELELAEPNRAREEIEALIASALHSVETGRKLDDVYVDALIKATFAVAERSDVDFDDHIDPYDALLALMRRLFEKQPDVWRLRLADVMERTSLDESSRGAPQDETAVLEDIDTLLAAAPATATLVLRRARLRLRVARTMLFAGNFDEAVRSIELADSLLRTVQALRLASDETAEVAETFIQGKLLKGDVYINNGNGPAAIEEYKSALRQAETNEEDTRTISEILLRLVRGYLISNPSAASEPALEWVIRNADNPSALGRLPLLVDAVSSANDPATASLKLARLLFPRLEQSDPYRSSSFSSRFLGANSSSRFIVSAARLVELVPEEDLPVLRGLVATISQMWPKGVLRGTAYIAARYEEIRNAIDILTAAAGVMGLDQEAARLTSISEQLVKSFRRQTSESRESDDGSA